MSVGTLHNAIHQKVASIIHEKLNFKQSILGTEYWDEPLTGKPLYLTGVELVYLFLEIEKVFGIRVMEEDLRDYGFATLNKIAAIIMQCDERT